MSNFCADRWSLAKNTTLSRSLGLALPLPRADEMGKAGRGKVPSVRKQQLDPQEKAAVNTTSTWFTASSIIVVGIEVAIALLDVYSFLFRFGCSWVVDRPKGVFTEVAVVKFI